MDKKKLQILYEQINKVITLLEDTSSKRQTEMITLIRKRYYHAKAMIESHPPEELAIEKFHIKGGVRAYLESASDYMNPMLEEMSKAEIMLEEAFK